MNLAPRAVAFTLSLNSPAQFGKGSKKRDQKFIGLDKITQLGIRTSGLWNHHRSCVYHPEGGKKVFSGPQFPPI